MWRQRDEKGEERRTAQAARFFQAARLPVVPLPDNPQRLEAAPVRHVGETVVEKRRSGRRTRLKRRQSKREGVMAGPRISRERDLTTVLGPT